MDPDAEQKPNKQKEDNSDGESEGSVASEVEEEERFTEDENVEDAPHDDKISTAANEAQSDETTTPEIVADETDEANSGTVIPRGTTGDGQYMLTRDVIENDDDSGSTTKNDLSNALGEAEDNGQTEHTTADLNGNQVGLNTPPTLAFVFTLSWPQILSQKACCRQTSPLSKRFPLSHKT